MSAEFAVISCILTFSLLIVGGIILLVDGMGEREFPSFLGELGLIIVAVITITAVVILSIKSDSNKAILQIVTLKLTEPTNITDNHYDNQDYVLFINGEKHTISAKT